MSNVAQPVKPRQSSVEDVRLKVKSLYEQISAASSFVDVIDDVEPEMLALLNAERVTVYQRNRHENNIISRFKSGSDVQEIRVPLSTTSIAGYVALSQQTLNIKDVYDAAALKKIHSNLKFDRSFDEQSGFRSRAMIVVPIKHGGALLGVLQALNHVGGGKFTAQDNKHALLLAQIIGRKFKDDLKGTDGPYDYLIDHGSIDRAKVDDLVKQARKRKVHPMSLIIQEGRISPADLGKSLEMFYQVPYQPFDATMKLPRGLFANLKDAYLRNQLCAPIAGDRKNVVLAIDDPSDYNRIMEIQRILRAEDVEVRVSLPDDIARFLDMAKGVSGPELETLTMQLEEETAIIEAEDLDLTEVDDGESDALVVQIVNKMISEAQHYGASDIHVEPGRNKSPTKVRMRIDGVCREVLEIPATRSEEVLARIKIMSRLDISERRKPQDGKCKLKIGSQILELRVATLPTVNGESAVLRLLAAAGALPMDKLNLTESNSNGIHKAISHPHGIFLVVGPTGSGKTTTLHAVLRELNKPDRKIWTAEDPVEITQPGLQQVQVAPKIEFTFAKAMRAFLRADPDIILIGEMRDQETSHIGVEASLTGHLVLSTLHTNSAPETITRLLDLGIDALNFSDALLGVLAQRLMRTLCSNCSEAYKPEKGEIQRLVNAYGKEHFEQLGVKTSEMELKKAKGCDKCGGSGYRGRTGIHELLVGSEEMKQLISSSGSVTEIRKLAVEQGMRTLMQDGVAKVMKGQSDMLQLFRVVAEE